MWTTGWSGQLQSTHITPDICLGTSLFVGKFFAICKGIARTQSPTIKNYALELPTFGVIVGVSLTGVQWRGLALEEPPSWSWLTSAPGKYEEGCPAAATKPSWISTSITQSDKLARLKHRSNILREVISLISDVKSLIIPANATLYVTMPSLTPGPLAEEFYTKSRPATCPMLASYSSDSTTLVFLLVRFHNSASPIGRRRPPAASSWLYKYTWFLEILI